MKNNSCVSKKVDFLYTLKAFFIILFILLVVSFAILFYVESLAVNYKYQEIQSSESQIVNMQSSFLAKELNIAISDLHYLKNAFSKELLNNQSLESIQDNWLIFSAKRGIYDQIRYIDENGNEIIRVNYSDKETFLTPKDQLQNKSDRYYYSETAILKNNETYVSPYDLNKEHGKIELPLKPMIRFSTPIYDKHNKFKGIIILNYLSEHLEKKFRQISNHGYGRIELINNNGYWLSSVDEENNFAFMYEGKGNLKYSLKYPEAWRKITSKKKGKFENDKGIFFYANVELEQQVKFQEGKKEQATIYLADENWYIVSTIDNQTDASNVLHHSVLSIFKRVIIDNWFIYMMIFIFTTLVSIIIYIKKHNLSQVEYYSEYDTMTNVLNRRAGLSRLSHFFNDANKAKTISLCYIDINGLKEINDTLGHKYGDDLIMNTIKLAKNCIRSDDFIVRLGGDEFLIVFTGIEKEAAEKVWDRLKGAFDTFNTSDNAPYIISVSHGIVEYKRENKASKISEVELLIKEADSRMYEEKHIIKQGLKVIKTPLPDLDKE